MRLAVAVCCILIASPVFAGEPLATKSEEAPVLLFPGAQRPDRLRVQVTRKGIAAADAWSKFLDRTFDHFDRNQDGTLDRAETARLIPFPILATPAGKSHDARELKIEFKGFDADKSGTATRAELREYCRQHGFGPVVIVIEPVSADERRLAELLTRRLDSNGDNRLSTTELKLAPGLLRKFDLNEDEFLDVAELLESAAVSPTMAAASAIAQAADAVSPDATLQLDCGATLIAKIIAGDRTQFQFVAPSSGSDTTGSQRLQGPQMRWVLAIAERQVLPDVSSTREFLLAQLRGAATNGESLSKSEIAADAALRGLGELVQYADTNGDDRLSTAELETFVNLIEQGVQSQVWIQVRIRGRNPFPLLDADGDGRLSIRELSQAGQLVGFAGPDGALIPWQFQISLRGPAATAWAGVPLPAARNRGVKVSPLAKPGKTVPPWFQAADRNGDGVVSPREFVGPPPAFQKLDADKNGVISPGEAGR